METKYVAHGKCFKKMDLKMTLPNGSETTVKVCPPSVSFFLSSPSPLPLSSLLLFINVYLQCHMRYFPFLDGAETLPVSFKEASMPIKSDLGEKPKGTKGSKSKAKGESKKKAKDAKTKGEDSSGGGSGGGGGGEKEGEREALPLQMRRHGFDVYWNGRLIPEAQFERYLYFFSFICYICCSSFRLSFSFKLIFISDWLL